MVTSLEDLQGMTATGPRRGLLVEIVGPPGAGKSTLFRALDKNVEWILGGYIPLQKDFSNVPFYAKNILSLVPILVRLLGEGDRNPNLKDIICMALLNGWHEILRKKVETTGKVIVLDQGAISIMMWLSMWGPQGLHNSNFQGWWNKVYEHWIQNLDMIVYIDTSVDILIKRIRHRYEVNNKKVIYHVNGKSDQEASDFLVKCRSVYEQIISRFEQNNHRMQVVKIDSGENNVDDIVRKVISEIKISK
jgi:thymidylate kinase